MNVIASITTKVIKWEISSGNGDDFEPGSILNVSIDAWYTVEEIGIVLEVIEPKTS